MFKPINGFTKEKMIEVIKARNTGKKCANLINNCLYDDGNGNHCAIGVFMPDDHEAMKFMGGSINLFLNYPDLQNVMPLDANTMGELQEVHDSQPLGTQVHGALINWINENVE